MGWTISFGRHKLDVFVFLALSIDCQGWVTILTLYRLLLLAPCPCLLRRRCHFRSLVEPEVAHCIWHVGQGGGQWRRVTIIGVLQFVGHLGHFLAAFAMIVMSGLISLKLLLLSWGLWLLQWFIRRALSLSAVIIIIHIVNFYRDGCIDEDWLLCGPRDRLRVQLRDEDGPLNLLVRGDFRGHQCWRDRFFTIHTRRCRLT